MEERRANTEQREAKKRIEGGKDNNSWREEEEQVIERRKGLRGIFRREDKGKGGVG